MSEPDRGIRTTVGVIDGGSELVDVLRVAPEVDVVTHITPRDELLDALWKTVPDGVVLAVDTPGIDVLAVCRELSEALPVCRILLVSDDGEAPFDAVVSGAAAVVSRTALMAQPGPIVQQVTRGEAIISRDWAVQMLRAYERDDAPHLTATEREVLQRLAKGSSSESIASLHEVPARLVRLHAAFALAKLHRAARDDGVSTEAM